MDFAAQGFCEIVRKSINRIKWPSLAIPAVLLLGSGGGSVARLPQSMPAVSVDSMGQATTAIALEVPAGSGGIVPQLALTYNSGAGWDLAGKGWSLAGLPAIERDPAGLKYAATDGFLSGLHGKLVLIDAGARIYHSKNESFTRYEAQGSCGSGPCQWTVTLRDGTRYFFGENPAERLLGPDGLSVRQWALSRVADHSGNGYSIEYVEGTGVLYPDEISYNNRRITFSWKNRPDQRRHYNQHAEEIHDRRLKRVEISAGSFERSYTLHYSSGEHSISLLAAVSQSVDSASGSADYQDIILSYSASTWDTDSNTRAADLQYAVRAPLSDNLACVFYVAECFCASLSQCGCDPWGNCVFPPCCTHKLAATGHCQDYFTKQHNYPALPDTWNTACNSGGLRYHTYLSGGDVNGDGRFDLIRLTGNESSIRLVVTFFAENGSMTDWSSPFSVPIAYNSFIGSGDFNGDGLTDFAFGRDGPLSIAYANGSGFNAPVATNVNVPSTNYPRISESHPIIATSFIADIDGDGRADFIQQTGSGFQISLSQGSSFAAAVSVSVPALGGQMQGFMDFNGDGRPEYVRLHGNTLYITEFSADFSGSVTQNFSVNPGDGSDHRWLADVNGDGRPDWLARNGNTVHVYLFTGTGFAGSGSVAAGTGPGKTGDVNGDGLADFIYRNGSNETILYSDGSGYNTANSRTFAGKIDIVVDTNGDGLPDLIGFGQSETVQLGHFAGVIGTVSYPTMELSQQRTAIPNALIRIDAGPEFADPTLETLIVYQPALHHSGATGGPRNYPDLPLMAPTWLVRNTAVRRGQIKTTAGWVPDQKTVTYNYSDRRIWQGRPENRRMAGFAQTEMVWPDGSRSLQRTHRSFPFAGMLSENLNYDSIGQLRSRSQTAYSVLSPFPGTERALPSSQREESYAGGVLVGSIDTTYEYDLYGNLIKETLLDGGSLVTERSHDNDLSAWTLGLLRTEVVTESGEIIKRKELNYQNGKVSSATSFVFPGSLSRTVSFEHDAQGNVVTTIGADNQRSRVSYDAQGIQPVETENALGHRTLSTYDDRGLLISATDANGNVTEHRYDTYGRPVRTIQPAESSSFTTEMVYTTSAYGSCVEIRKSDASPEGYYYSRSCSDFAGRIYLRESKGYTDPDSGTTHTILRLVDYDAEGRRVRESASHVPELRGPAWTEYEYSADGIVSQVRTPDGTVSNTTILGLTSTVSDSHGRVVTTLKNSKGQVLEETTPAGLVRYGYDIYGHVNRITGEDGSVSEFKHNSDGQVIWQKDSTSGEAQFEYDGNGRLLSSTDARGITIRFEYDELGRQVRTILPAGEGEIVQTYDTAPNGRGRLAEIQDVHGSRRFAYDARGNVASMVRTVDGVAFSFAYEYDSMNRPVSITYPDGSEVKNHYSSAGKLAGVTLEGYPVVEYFGPLAGQKLRRKAANGVETEIDYDAVQLRPTAYRTKLATGTTAQNITLAYDQAGNITKIDNILYPARTQEFTYDAQGRVLTANSLQGSEIYNYQHGNLTRMGERTFHYTDAAHPHRIMRVDAPPGSTMYAYDAAGNVIQRGDIRFDYDGAGRLQRVLGPNFDERYRYGYEVSGRRIKKERVPDQTTTYYIDGVYELVRSPGKPDKHTLYVKGFQDEVVAQYTRENVILTALGDQARFVALSKLGWSELVSSGALFFVLGKQATPLQKKAIRFFQTHSRKLSPRVALLILVALALLYGLWIALRPETEIRPAYAFPVPLLSLAILFTAPHCFGLDQITGVKKDGPPPWLALAAIPQNQAAVSDNPGVDPGPGIYDPGSHGMPTVGMFYFHPDHLGSVTMITDSYGNYVSGVDIGTGHSHISYKPYGEINRTNSGGPDIFRYKYTQQEEDPETGFYYYKSRYYDPYSGRFMQPDSFTFPGQTGGMNRYMYVHGNPVKFDDPTGHSPWWKEADSWKTWTALAIIDSGGINQAMSNLSGNLNDGLNNLQGNLDDFTRGAGNFMSGLVSNLEDAGPLLGAVPGMKEQAKRFSATWEAGFPGQHRIQYNDTVGYMALMYEGSGMTPEAFGKLYAAAMFINALGEKACCTFSGHEYTGNGNKDQFSKFNSHGNKNQQRDAFLLLSIFALKYGVETEHLIGFAMMVKHLGPKPRSRVDLASQRHDRAVPGAQFYTDPCQHIKADREFAETVMDYRIFYDRPEAWYFYARYGFLGYGGFDQSISGARCRLGI